MNDITKNEMKAYIEMITKRQKDRDLFDLTKFLTEYCNAKNGIYTTGSVIKSIDELKADGFISNVDANRYHIDRS